MAMFSLFMATTTLATGATGAVTIPAEPQATILETIVSTVTETVSDAADGLDDEMETCAAKIDAYYTKQNVPLAGYGKVFAQAAADNGADCEIATLAAAIGMKESTGGKFTPGSGANESFNAFGFGCSDSAGKKCKKYEGFEDAINVVIDKLVNSKLYAGKSITAKLNTYNPPHIVATIPHAYGDEKWYVKQVTGIMKKINNIDVSDNDQLASR